MFEVCDAFPRLDQPHSARRVGRSCEQAPRKAITIQAPYGTLVAVKRAQALTIVGSPYGWYEILGSGKQKIAVVVVLDRRNGTFMSLQKERSL